MAIPVMARTMRPVSIDDLISVRKPTELALSPDGRWVAYVVMSPGLRDNSYTHDLYVVPSSGKGQPQRVLQGEPQTGSLAAHQRLSPTWAPGSDRLAISATRADGVEVRVVHIDSAKSELLLKSQMIGEDMELKLGDWRGSVGFAQVSQDVDQDDPANGIQHNVRGEARCSCLAHETVHAMRHIGAANVQAIPQQCGITVAGQKIQIVISRMEVQTGHSEVSTRATRMERHRGRGEQ